MKTQFALNLSEIMIERGISQSELARLSGISQSSISDYLNSRYEPKQDKVDAIATALMVSPSMLVGTQPHPLETAPNLTPYQLSTLRLMRGMSLQGQEVVYNQAELVKATGKYNRPDVVEDYTPLYTLGTAAAGSGHYNIDGVETYRLIMTTEIPEHDFTLDVEGDSMFPSIMDGDVVFVVKDYDKIDNKIYVLDIDGETVVKRVVFETDKIILKSDNPEWDDREVTGFELEHTRIEGRVVGWETPE